MQMSDEELNTILDEMYDRFGALPNPFQEPIQFAHRIKLYRFYKERELAAEQSTEITESTLSEAT
jgi:transcription-repair coupling factor (superfamily II helicase)